MKRLSLKSVIAVAVCLPSLSALAQTAADWPSKPLRMLVGSAPGGGTDAMARAVVDRLAPLLKQPIVVENRPGVSNTIAADVTAKSTDGHTMVMGVSTAHAIAPHLFKLGYDSNKDLVPVAFVGTVPNVLVVTNGLPAQNVQQLIALAKSEPGKLNYASSGAGSTQHIAAEIFKDAAGIDVTHVPYKGSAPALIDLVGGQVQMSFDTMPSVIGQIKNGKVRPLAVTSAKRSAQLPQVPTTTEVGMPSVQVNAWYGVYMPSSTPKAIQQQVHDLVNKVISLPETKTRLEAVGAELNPISQIEFLAFHNAEFKRYGEIIHKKNIKID
ncbi:ABC transporter substrate-binding protein [Limnohabitans sp. Rim8]|uniref:Bug family tripartite tricarboxylate transporter substrate binding protein n=1 Tax=Limnohabitans sp. Rim8 TaxID=1100718 RepID=UPI000D3498AF|nr:tripartite tricarboxylate transporter substrate binding protein [Limnohabitans sp. Rim8]PUE57543.1 ABC transporter substrate-binding protein [Limnohabitans sp. Rim8]